MQHAMQQFVKVYHVVFYLVLLCHNATVGDLLNYNTSSWWAEGLVRAMGWPAGSSEEGMVCYITYHITCCIKSEMCCTKYDIAHIFFGCYITSCTTCYTTVCENISPVTYFYLLDHNTVCNFSDLACYIYIIYIYIYAKMIHLNI